VETDTDREDTDNAIVKQLSKEEGLAEEGVQVQNIDRNKLRSILYKCNPGVKLTLTKRQIWLAVV